MSAAATVLDNFTEAATTTLATNTTPHTAIADLVADTNETTFLE